MKLRPLYLLLLCALGAAFPVLASEEQAVAARSSAFDLAGAFSANDGYKLRDGFYATPLKPGEAKIFKVNLYAGNSYWFCVAAVPAAGAMEVVLSDENGKPLPIQQYHDGSRAAAGITAAYSGSYYVKITLTGEKSSEVSTVCLLYAYK